MNKLEQHIEKLQKENRDKYTEIEKEFPIALESWSTEDWKNEVDTITTNNVHGTLEMVRGIVEGMMYDNPVGDRAIEKNKTLKHLLAQITPSV